MAITINNAQVGKYLISVDFEDEIYSVKVFECAGGMFGYPITENVYGDKKKALSAFNRYRRKYSA